MNTPSSVHFWRLFLCIFFISPLITTRECDMVIFSVASVCLCVCLSCSVFRLWPLNALTYKLYFWYASTPSECLGEGLASRSLDQCQGRMSVTKTRTQVSYVFDRKAIDLVFKFNTCMCKIFAYVEFPCQISLNIGDIVVLHESPGTDAVECDSL